MNKVIIESPYASNTKSLPSDYTEGWTIDDWKKEEVERNLLYLRACMRDSVVNYEESPYASHGLLTQEGVLDDTNEEERNLGIKAGFEWRRVADYSVFYLDRGFSRGMEYGFRDCLSLDKPIKYRAFLDYGGYRYKRTKSFELSVKFGDKVEIEVLSPIIAGIVTIVIASSVEEGIKTITDKYSPPL